MLTTARLIITPIVSLTILMVGNGFFTTFLAVRLYIGGETSFVVGAITAAYYAGMVVGAFRMERLISRIGHIRAFAALASLLAVFTMLHGLYYDPWFWVMLRFLGGVCLAGLFIIIEAWLLAISDNSTRGRILSLYMIGIYGPQALGQFLLNIADLESMMPFAITVMLCSLAVVPLAMTYIQAPQISKPSGLSFLKLYRLSPSGILGCFCAGMVLAAIYGLVPLFLSQRELSLEEISATMGLIIFGGMLLQYPVGKLSDTMNRRRVLTLLSLSFILLSIGIIITSLMHWDYWFMLLAFLFGGVAFTLYPLSISHACSYVESNDIIAASQGLLLAYGIGASVGPLLAPGFMRLIGPMGLFVYFIVLGGVLAVFFMWRQTQREAPTVEEQTDFIAMPTTTPLSKGLDPRADE